ncbi:MAG: hypothetical protein ACR2KP_08230, partial [Egibacteraceae bacterium]
MRTTRTAPGRLPPRLRATRAWDSVGRKSVGRKHDVGHGEGGALGHPGQGHPGAVSELLSDELGEEIVMVEDHPAAKRPREP